MPGYSLQNNGDIVSESFLHSRRNNQQK